MSAGPVRRLALFGHPLGHSRSKDLYDALARAGGPEVTFEPVDVRAEGLAHAVARLRAGEWDGAHVTIPHKEAVLALADAADPPAHRARSANVLARQADGRLVAASTDGEGLARAFGEVFGAAGAARLFGGAWLVLGGGGAARAIAERRAAAGPGDIVVVSRDPAHAAPDTAGLAGRVRTLAWDDPRFHDAAATAQVVVQATSLGMAPAVDARPALDPDLVQRAALAVDIVYNPWATRFAAALRTRGVRVLNGWPMLVHQAAAALATWWGHGDAAAAQLVAAARSLESRDPLRSWPD